MPPAYFRALWKNVCVWNEYEVTEAEKPPHAELRNLYSSLFKATLKGEFARSFKCWKVVKIFETLTW
jgi:hypothetical protein